MGDNRAICKINKKILKYYGINVLMNKVYIGSANIQHIIASHPADYNKYGRDIKKIVSNPDFVSRKPNDPSASIEFIKNYQSDNCYILVAVRASLSGVFYVRTIFKMDIKKVSRYMKSGTMIKVSSL